MTPELVDISSENISSAGLRWPGASNAQMVFMRSVYNARLRRSSSRGNFVADVPNSELSIVEPRRKLRNNAAHSARNLLSAARSAIALENVRVRIGLTSAYRSASRQFQLWQNYFPDYYRRTQSRRQTMPGGEHGNAAVRYMSSFVGSKIATPGYSNHNNGLAMDILNIENGRRKANSTRANAVAAWRNSWLWQWLVSNAGHYNFYQNTNINEPWHWEYRRTRTGGFDEYYAENSSPCLENYDDIETNLDDKFESHSEIVEEAIFPEDVNQSVRLANELRRGASANAIRTLFNRVSGRTGLGHPSLPNNPLIGISRDMILSAYNAHHFHGATKLPSLLLALWVKEGGAQMHERMKLRGRQGFDASTAENAKSLFRSSLYFSEMGIDKFIAYRSQAGSDNIPVPLVDANAATHETVFRSQIARLTTAGYLTRNITSSINSNLRARLIPGSSPRRYSIVPINHFYIYSLLLLDALFREFEGATKRIIGITTVPDIGLTYMCWNMGEGQFAAFIRSANRHRLENEYRTNNRAPSIAQWAFENRAKSNEWAIPRHNAIKFRYYKDVYNLIYPSNSGGNSEYVQHQEHYENNFIGLEQIANRRDRFSQNMASLTENSNQQHIDSHEATQTNFDNLTEVLPPSRPCCILAPSDIPFSPNNNFVEIGSLGTHGSASEKNGLIYCGKAGFVDLGHLRETCDLTKHIFDEFISHSGSPMRITTIHGKVDFHMSPIRRLWIPLAMKISYIDSLGHEIMTYSLTGPGTHNSSFSPEDLCSNYLGTELARRAILRGGPFNAAVSRELLSLLRSLDPQSIRETARAFNRINSRWVDFSNVSSLMSNSYLKRRNFTRRPWKAGHSSDRPTPSWVINPLMNTANFFTYTHTMIRPIPESSFASEIARIRRDAGRKYGRNYDKP